MSKITLDKDSAQKFGKAMGFNDAQIKFSALPVEVKKLNENAILPTRGSDNAAGYDLYACIDEPIVIKPHQTEKISTGLAFSLPPFTYAGIFARSGLATKEGLRPANCQGICDPDYRGPYIVALHNDTDTERVVTPKERIAQMILLPFFPMEFIEKDNLDETERGAGGFGSTGTN